MVEQVTGLGGTSREEFSAIEPVDFDPAGFSEQVPLLIII